MSRTADKIIKTFISKPINVDEENFTVLTVVSDETIDRYDEIIKITAWDKGLDNYKKHPILLSSHDYSKLTSQIGYAEDIYIDNEKKALVAKFKYFIGEGNEEADWGFFLAKQGLAAFSVGFKPRPNGVKTNSIDDVDVQEGKKPTRVYTDIELLEISQVVVPANPSALQKSLNNVENQTDEVMEDITMYKKMMLDILKRKVIPYHKYPLAPKDMEWDASSEVSKATVEDLKQMCAVIVGDPENKTSYKLPHHTVDGYKTVWRAVVNAAARLNQTDMPDEDKEGVKAHLAKHYEDFGEEAPWIKEKELWNVYENNPSLVDEDSMKKLFDGVVLVESNNTFDDLIVLSVSTDDEETMYEGKSYKQIRNTVDLVIKSITPKLDIIAEKLDVVVGKLDELIHADIDYDKLASIITNSINVNKEEKSVDNASENAIKKIISDMNEIHSILSKYQDET